MISRTWRTPFRIGLAALVAVMVLATPASIDMARPHAAAAAGLALSIREEGVAGSVEDSAPSVVAPHREVQAEQTVNAPSSATHTPSFTNSHPAIWIYILGIGFVAVTLAVMWAYLKCGRWHCR